VGSKAYVVKTDIDNSGSFLFQITNFTKSNAAITSNRIKDSSGKAVSVGHTGSMTEYNGNIYLASSKQPNDANYIFRLDPSGVIKQKITPKPTCTINTITYFRADTFIVHITGAVSGITKPSGTHLFAVAKLVGNELQLTKYFFGAADVSPNNTWKRQDIAYRSLDGCLYMITNDGTDPQHHTTKNRILRMNLSETIVANKTYPISSVITSNKSTTSTTKIYELESPIIYSGNLYAATNVKTGNDACGDRFYKISF
jgi:hypothetical protein